MERDIRYDNIKGVLIYLVVLAHILYSVKFTNSLDINIITSFIYTFHMPLFFIVSGYFSKKINSKSLIHLMLLFIMLDLSYILYNYIITSNLEFGIKYSSWYMLALFIYRLMVFIDRKNIFKKFKIPILILLFLSSIFSGFLNISDTRYINFFLFFYLGYITDFKKIKINKVLSFIGCIIVLSILFLISRSNNSLNFYMGSIYFSNFEFLIRTTIYILDILLFIFVYNISVNKKIIFISKFGRNSLSIYMIHRIITLIINEKFMFTDYFYIIAIVSSFLICLIFSSNLINRFFKSK